jgi:hypothetical protein
MPFKNIWEQPVRRVPISPQLISDASLTFLRVAPSLLWMQIVQIHLLGKPATDKLKRPFKTGGGFMGPFSFPLFLLRTLLSLTHHTLCETGAATGEPGMFFSFETHSH